MKPIKKQNIIFTPYLNFNYILTRRKYDKRDLSALILKKDRQIFPDIEKIRKM